MMEKGHKQKENGASEGRHQRKMSPMRGGITLYFSVSREANKASSVPYFFTPARDFLGPMPVDKPETSNGRKLHQATTSQKQATGEQHRQMAPLMGVR